MSSASSLTALSLSFALLAGSACAAHADLSGSALADSASPSVVSDVETGALPVAPQSDAAGLLANNPPPTATPAVPLDGGWIYHFGGSGTNRAVYRVAPTGGGRSLVPGAPADYGADLTPPGDGAIGQPSHQSHGGSRWYLAYRWSSADAVFPNADHVVAVEVDAVREGDTVGLALTSNRASCIYVSGSQPAWVSSASGSPDAGITWLGAQWADQDSDPNTCETLVGGGIFRADLTYDGTGAVSGITTPTLALPVPMNAANTAPDVSFFSWSPDAAQVAYVRESNGDLYRATAGSPVSSHVVLSAGTYRNVDWSPDQDPLTAGFQTTIAFSGSSSGTKSSYGIWGIKPDGTGTVLLAKPASTRTVSYGVQTPFWSPTGSHLAYEEHQTQIGAPAYSHTIRRMAKDGSGNTVIATESSSQPLHSLLEWTNFD